MPPSGGATHDRGVGRRRLVRDGVGPRRSADRRRVDDAAVEGPFGRLGRGRPRRAARGLLSLTGTTSKRSLSRGRTASPGSSFIVPTGALFRWSMQAVEDEYVVARVTAVARQGVHPSSADDVTISGPRQSAVIRQKGSVTRSLELHRLPQPTMRPKGPQIRRGRREDSREYYGVPRGRARPPRAVMDETDAAFGGWSWRSTRRSATSARSSPSGSRSGSAAGFRTADPDRRIAVCPAVDRRRVDRSPATMTAGLGHADQVGEEMAAIS